MYLYMSTHVSHTSTYIHTYMCTRVCCVRLYIIHEYMNTWIHLYIYTSIYLHIYMSISVYLYMSLYLYVYICACIHVHTCRPAQVWPINEQKNKKMMRYLLKFGKSMSISVYLYMCTHVDLLKFGDFANAV